MEYEVEVLSPAYDFIQTLDIKMRAKTLRTIELLKQFGPFLTEPHVKKLKNIKNLAEKIMIQFLEDKNE